MTPYDELQRRVKHRMAQRAEFNAHLFAYLIVNILGWILLSMISGMEGMRWLMLATTLGWGAGLGSHLITLWRGPEQMADRIDAQAIDELTRVYGEDWRDQVDQSDFEQVRKRAAERVNKVKDFLIHAWCYGTINLLIWLVWTSWTGAQSLWLPLAVTVLWGMGLAIHGATTFTVARETDYQKELAREIERERLRADLLPKAKRAPQQDDDAPAAMRLSDDGELIEIEDKPKRAQL